MSSPLIVAHKKCGTQIGWYADTHPVAGKLMQARRYTRMDGTQYEKLQHLNEYCPACDKRITDFRSLKIGPKESNV